MVEKYIKKGFYLSNYLVLPDFGGFVLSYKGAQVDSFKQLIFPPSKNVAFNAKLTQNDGYLASLVAEGEKIGMEEASLSVHAYVKALQAELKKNGKVSIKDIGVFYTTEEGNIRFEVEQKQNFLLQSFFLPVLKLSPKKTKEAATLTFKNKKKMAFSNQSKSSAQGNESETKPTKANAQPVLVTLLILLSFSGTYLIFYNQPHISHGSFNPIEWINHQDEIISDSSIIALGASQAAQPLGENTNEENSGDTGFDTNEQTKPLDQKNETLDVTQPMDAEQSKESSSQILDTHNKRYFVIIGGFKDVEKALVLRDKLEADGVDSKILQPAKGNTLYRVSLADFDTFEEAMKKSEELRPTYGDGIWVLVYDLGK